MAPRLNLSRLRLPPLRRPLHTAVPPPPSKGAAQLTNRALISVRGPDASKFLQGLITTHVPEAGGDGTFSCFLTSNGRILSDAFIYPTPSSSYLIELSALMAPNILSILQRRKLRSNLTLTAIDPSTISVYSLWDNGAPPTSFTPSTTATAILTTDHRCPSFGLRLIAPPNEADEIIGGEGLEPGPIEQYTLRRYLAGIPEGAELPPERALPQQSCIDYMQGIDYRKGCYVGQELTIRTHHRGVVRRRVLPVQLSPSPFAAEEHRRPVVYDPGVEIPSVAPGTTITRVGRKAREPGTVIGSIGNVGLALCRLAIMTEEGVAGEKEWESGDQFLVKGEDGREVFVRAVVPGWHKERAEALKR